MESGDFYFLEVNTRLQVEHGVTEEVTGVDLVEWMVRQAAGQELALEEFTIRCFGCSIEARVYAEDAAKNFQPSVVRLSHVSWPEKVRVETWVEAGTEVTPFYDPMLAKIIVHAPSREAAFHKLRVALRQSELSGLETNLPYLRQICEGPALARGCVTTSFLRDLVYLPLTIDVLEPGTQTTIQDFPGRLGYWHVGVPPSGPMDSLAFRFANRLVGNAPDAAGLEITLAGPTLRFSCDATVALTGADFGARLDDRPVPLWQAVFVRRGSVLELGAAKATGTRAYLALAGGIEAPLYLGSRSTFILGKFGGQSGRTLRAGDVLHIGNAASSSGEATKLPEQLIPRYENEWEIGALYGPHGAPDFFTPEDIDTFFATAWRVHYNSSRTGVRLIGPKPEWARRDGGEAGLHPSNIHDNAYAIGAIDFTGDMPVILGPDGPSLGGFGCPAVPVDAELPALDDLTIPTRIVNLPLSWDDPATRLAIEKYMKSVRPDAPWCPSNIEFIRRINGLDSTEDVKRIVFNASYLVLGLGDVYLGAPVATPVDPRHRLVTTKHNPARTWTAENSVGIGGAYLCVYGMEGPGGYQFVGRTVQMWNTYRSTPEFEPGTPWLLRFFDQIRFFPVSANELLEIRDAFPHGKYSLEIEHSDFSVKKYRDYLFKISREAADFKKRQQGAFIAERERWAAAGQPEFVEPSDSLPSATRLDVPDGCEAVRSPMSASVWQIAV